MCSVIPWTLTKKLLIWIYITCTVSHIDTHTHTNTHKWHTCMHTQKEMRKLMLTGVEPEVLWKDESFFVFVLKDVRLSCMYTCVYCCLHYYYTEQSMFCRLETNSSTEASWWTLATWRLSSLTNLTASSFKMQTFCLKQTRISTCATPTLDTWPLQSTRWDISKTLKLILTCMKRYKSILQWWSLLGCPAVKASVLKILRNWSEEAAHIHKPCQ